MYYDMHKPFRISYYTNNKMPGLHIHLSLHLILHSLTGRRQRSSLSTNTKSLTARWKELLKDWADLWKAYKWELVPRAAGEGAKKLGPLCNSFSWPLPVVLCLGNQWLVPSKWSMKPNSCSWRACKLYNGNFSEIGQLVTAHQVNMINIYTFFLLIIYPNLIDDDIWHSKHFF